MLPALSALLNHYTRPGEGAVYGLDNSVAAGARAVAPLVGASVAILFGLRGTFALTGLMFMVTSMLVIWKLLEVRPSQRVGPAPGD